MNDPITFDILFTYAQKIKSIIFYIHIQNIILGCLEIVLKPKSQAHSFDIIWITKV